MFLKILYKLGLKLLDDIPGQCGSVGWGIVPYTERSWGPIPSQGIYLDCGFRPWLRYLQGWGLTVFFSHIDVSLLFSASLLLSLKSISMSLSEDLKKLLYDVTWNGYSITYQISSLTV